MNEIIVDTLVSFILQGMKVRSKPKLDIPVLFGRS